MTPARFARRFAAAAVLALSAAAPAQAYHIPGATYEGQHSQGGRISFTVTSDGEGISSFSAYGPIRGDRCTFGSPGQPLTSEYVQPLSIIDHTFEGTSGTFRQTGSFPGVQRAEGTWRAQTRPPMPSCDSGELTWTATTTASPAGSEECRSARAAVRRARSAVRRARTRAAKRRARARLRRAQARQRANCEG